MTCHINKKIACQERSFSYFGKQFVYTFFFIRNSLSPSTGPFSNFSQFQYQIFLKTSLAKIVEFPCIAHAHLWKVKKLHVRLK